MRDNCAFKKKRSLTYKHDDVDSIFDCSTLAGKQTSPMTANIFCHIQAVSSAITKTSITQMR